MMISKGKILVVQTNLFSGAEKVNDSKSLQNESYKSTGSGPTRRSSNLFRFRDSKVVDAVMPMANG